MSRDSIYGIGGAYDAESIACRLHGLCKVGAAASDSVLGIDLHKGGWTDFFEAMASQCDELIEALHAEDKNRKGDEAADDA